MAAKLEFHPASEIFPLLEGKEFDELVDSIKTNGQQVPILLHQGKVLDGRNRYLACLKAKVDPWTDKAELDGKSPVEYVLLLNMTRRHLTFEQRIVAAAEAKKLFESDAQARMKSGKAPDPTAPVPEGSPGESREKAAKAFDVSPRTVDHASKVLEHGSVALVEAMKSGNVSVTTAAKLADLPKMQQVTALKGGKLAIESALAGPCVSVEEKKSKPTTADLMEDWNTAIESWARSVPQLVKSIPEGAWMDQNRVEIITSQLKAAANTARAVKGHDLCPKCKGEGCKKCRKTGWLNKVDFESAAT